MKTAIVIFSDPKQGEEALGRVFNALGAALEMKTAGDDVLVVFQGTGTRWIGELAKKDHLLHGLFNAVLDKIAGASCGCADVFGAAEDVNQGQLPLLRDNPIPGTTGVASFRKYLNEGYTVLTF
ncbi:MAG: DsrE family protein [Bryobacter sp.]|nr:DsrE family protein [Bryobacter sp.]